MLKQPESPEEEGAERNELSFSVAEYLPKQTSLPDAGGVIRDRSPSIDERFLSIAECLGKPTSLSKDEGGVIRDLPSSKLGVPMYLFVSSLLLWVIPRWGSITATVKELLTYQ